MRGEEGWIFFLWREKTGLKAPGRPTPFAGPGFPWGATEPCVGCGKAVKNKLKLCTGCGYHKQYMRSRDAARREFKRTATIDISI